MSINLNITFHPLDPLPGLTRLEQSLGLARPQLPQVDRLFRYASSCTAAEVEGWRASLELDRFGTAHHLLQRREEALLAGWDGVAPTTSALADLAKVEAALSAGPGRDLDTVADRLCRIAHALEQGLRVTVPVEVEQRALWPKRWQDVLAALGASSSPPMGPAGSGFLGAWQRSLAGAQETLGTDATLALTTVSSRVAATQVLAAALGQATLARRAATVVVCADAALLSGLDDRLTRAGLPRLGAPSAGAVTALDGLLPLVLALCWDPVDPEVLLEYCLLPEGPLGRRAGHRLAEGLAEFPGLGSRSWDAAVAELTAPEADPDGSMAARLARWFSSQRVPMGAAAPADLLAERCRAVAAWAGGRAATRKTDPSETAFDAGGRLRTLAGQASGLADQLATAGGRLTAPAVARILADTLPGTAAARHPAEAGSPLLVAEPWQIPPGTVHAIWISPHAHGSATPVWTAQELAALSSAGLPIDDGQALATARRESDRQGLARISADLLIVELPAASDQRRHPAVASLRSSLQDRARKTDARQAGTQAATTAPGTIIRLDDSTQVRLSTAGWLRRTTKVRVVPPQPERLAWDPPAEGLRDRDQHSYSELERRLACPLAWTLTYAAKLRPGGATALPALHNLEGSFAHAVLETVFATGIPTPARAAKSAAAEFDARLHRDAPPLALPGRQVQRVRLRDRVVAMAELLAETLTRAGCSTVAMEAPIPGKVGTWAMTGSIDCLATAPGLAVIVDLKLGSLEDRRTALADGRAIQLAVYAASRPEPKVAVAYGIINGRRLLTPAGAAIPQADGLGCEIVPDAPHWRTTWAEFSAALKRDRGWLKGDPIPARPLGDPGKWPEGATLVLATEEDPDLGIPVALDNQPCCEHCDFGTLCGREERN